MKKTALAFFLLITACFRGQVLQEYFFNNNFNGTNGGGTLSEVLACGAGLGSFGSQSITTSAGFCSYKSSFCFNDGGGLSYPNGSITGDYSINVFCRFNTLGGYTRIIDFSNGASDNGIYLLNNCLVLYPVGTIGACPYFNPNIYYMFTFVRDGATGLISVYVDGVLFGSYLDNGNLYRPANNMAPIVFFRDDIVAACETQPGCIAYASISSSTLSAAQVNTVWQSICNTVSTCTANAGPDYSICPGQSVTIGGAPTATGGNGSFTYNWLPAAGLSSTTVANPVATPTVSTTYTVVINDGNGCITTDKVQITITPFPNVIVSPNATVCPTGSVALVAGGAVSYTWSPGAGLSAVNGASVAANPLLTIVYTVTGMSAAGCNNTATVQVFAGSSPTVTVSPGATICPSGSVALTAGGGLGYTWLPSGSLSSGNGATVAASPSVTTVYTVTGTNSIGCTATASVQVVVTPNPTLTVSPNITICPSGSATLVAGGAISYTWLPFASLNSGNAATVIATPAATTVYAVSGSNTNNCQATTTVQVFVAANPTLTISPNATICPSGAAILTASGAISYAWLPAASLNPANAATVTASPAATTVYTVSGFNANSCLGTATVQIFVAANPTLMVSTNATICPSGTVALTAGGAVSYTWLPLASLSSGNGANVTATPATTTIYTVSGANGNGCRSTATVQVLVDANPQLSVSPNVTICPSGTVALTAGGAASYTWSPSGSLSPANAATVTASPAATTVYTVTGSNGNGCRGSASVQVWVDANPSLTVSPNTTICPSGTVVLTTGGALSYTWLPSASLSSANATTVTASPAATTIYTVLGSNGTTCNTGVYVQVLVDTNPVLAVSPDVTICPAGNTTLTVSGAVSYTWTLPAPLPAANGASLIAGPAGVTVYTVTGVNGNGCSSMATVKVFVDTNPIVQASPNATSCASENVTLTASGALSYTWNSSSSLNLITGATVTVNPAGTTTYTVSGANANGCKATATLQVLVNPKPQVTATGTLICLNEPFTLVSSGAGTYTWNGPSVANSVTASIFVPIVNNLSTGNYTVIGTGANGCTNIAVAVISTLALPAIAAAGNTVCFGNPATLSASGGIGSGYSWFGPGGSVFNGPNMVITSANGSSAGVYTVVGTAANSCTAAANATLAFTSLPQPSIVSPGRVCFRSSIGMQGLGASTYTWTGPYNYYSTNKNVLIPIYNMQQQGTYTLSVSDSLGCFNSTTTVVKIDPAPNARLISDNLNKYCVPFCSSFSVSSNDASPITNVTWLVNNTTPFSGPSFNYCVTSPESNEVIGTFTNSLGCTNKIIFNLATYPNPVADFDYLPLKPVQGLDQVVFTTTSTGDSLVKWNWFFIDNKGYTVNSENASYIFENAGVYNVAHIVTNGWGCADTVVKTITVSADFNLFIPNAFTPDGDGLNDTFRPKGTGVQKFDLTVYDRWGQELFHTNDFMNGWDGTLHGIPCTDDVYIWRIITVDINGKTRENNGHVMLAR